MEFSTDSTYHWNAIQGNSDWSSQLTKRLEVLKVEEERKANRPGLLSRIIGGIGGIISTGAKIAKTVAPFVAPIAPLIPGIVNTVKNSVSDVQDSVINPISEFVQEVAVAVPPLAPLADNILNIGNPFEQATSWDHATDGADMSEPVISPPSVVPSPGVSIDSIASISPSPVQTMDPIVPPTPTMAGFPLGAIVTGGFNLLKNLFVKKGVSTMAIPAVIGGAGTAVKAGLGLTGRLLKSPVGAIAAGAAVGLTAEQLTSLEGLGFKLASTRKRRRRRIATETDIRDLAALKAVLGSGQAFSNYLARARI